MTDQIRGTNPNHFRAGRWADLVGVDLISSLKGELRPNYLVKFDDGESDHWLVDDLDAGYEFRTAPVYDYDTEMSIIGAKIAEYLRAFGNTHTVNNNTASDLNILGERVAWFLAGHGLLKLGEDL